MSAAATGAGARLKAAREQRGMSLKKAAGELRLEAPVVEALEAGDLLRVGPTVYAKGYLRRYALLLGLPVEEILGAYGIGNALPIRADTAPDRIVPVRQPVSAPQMLGGLAAALLLAAVVWWKPWTQPTPEMPAAAPAEAPVAERAPTVLPDEPVVAHAPAPEPRHPRAAAVARALPVSVPASAPRSATTDSGANEAATEQPGAGRARLRLSFTSDSWVEVRDAQGNKAFVGNGSANTVKSIAGQAPMHVYLRRGSGVQLELNGHTVAIGTQFFAGDVARFQAGADGVLRREPPRETSAANTRPPG